MGSLANDMDRADRLARERGKLLAKQSAALHDGGTVKANATALVGESTNDIGVDHPHMFARSTTARNAFFNACRILMNLDDRDLESAGIYDLRQFYVDPLTVLARLDDPSADALWALIQRRQPERYRGI